MSITRRQFLFSILAAGAGFILTSFFDKAVDVLAETGSCCQGRWPARSQGCHYDPDRLSVCYHRAHAQYQEFVLPARRHTAA